MDAQTEAVFIELKAKYDRLKELKQIESIEKPKLDSLLAKQEEVFDFKREEQMQNKKIALIRLRDEIKKHSDEYTKLFNKQGVSFNSRVRNEKERLIKEDSRIIESNKRISELEQELEQAKQALNDSVQAFDKEYNQELSKLGNDIIRLRIDPFKHHNL